MVGAPPGGYFYFPPAPTSAAAPAAPDPALAEAIRKLAEKVDALATPQDAGNAQAQIRALQAELADAKRKLQDVRAPAAGDESAAPADEAVISQQNMISQLQLARAHDEAMKLKQELADQSERHQVELDAVARDAALQQSALLARTRAVEEELAYANLDGDDDDPVPASDPISDRALAIVNEEAEALRAQVTALEARLAEAAAAAAASEAQLAAAMKQSSALLAQEQRKTAEATAALKAAEAKLADQAAAFEAERDRLFASLVAATKDAHNERAEITAYARSLEERLAYVDDEEGGDSSSEGGDDSSSKLAEAEAARASAEARAAAAVAERDQLAASLAAATKDSHNGRAELTAYARSLEERLAYVDDEIDDEDAALTTPGVTKIAAVSPPPAARGFQRNPPGTFELKRRVTKVSQSEGNGFQLRRFVGIAGSPPASAVGFQRSAPGTFQLRHRVTKRADVALGGFQRSAPGTFQLRHRVTKRGASS